MKMPLFRSAFAATIAAFAALVLAAAPAWAGSQPQGALDECYGKTLAVHVKGWTYDPDVSSQSTGVQVYLYADSGCTRQYGDVRILAADQPRSDVNRVKGVEGDHGFDADIPVPAGTYWVKVFAVDATGDGNLQVGATRSVVVAERGKVQLWEGGPYWATTNIGADEPEDYGYYFWWGDTVGYTNNGSGWISVKDGTEIGISFYSSGTAAPTYGKDNSVLLSTGYIDSTGNLAPEHDAAHVHWGGAWRMPTAAEFSALIDNCTTTWTTKNGVYGRLVTGKGAYADRSIFLPAAGWGNGNDSGLNYTGSDGSYWSSTPDSDYVNPTRAWDWSFYSGYFGRDPRFRWVGLSVRPVFPAPIDLSALTADYTAKDGDVLTGETTYNVTVPGGATVTINGISVTSGGTVNPTPAFAKGDASEIVKFAQAEGGKWTITAFAEMSNESRGTDVTNGMITVYSADTLEELKSATSPVAGATVKEAKSAVKAVVEVPAPSGKDSQFFKVKFGE